MITSSLLRPVSIVVALSLAASLFGATPKSNKKAAPAVPAKKPAVRVDSTPVNEGGKPGLVLTYADILEPAQRAVVSVYSTKFVKERIRVDPFFRQFFGIPDQERESKLE